jgi:hypothetical protein
MVEVGYDPESGPIYAPASYGIIGEHLHAAGLESHVIADGRQIVAIDGKIVEVLCSELIRVRTEDGDRDGRCGTPLRGDAWACPGHTQELEGWMSMSEIDRAEWEYRHEMEAF